MRNDDRRAGRLLGRRELLGAMGAAWLTAGWPARAAGRPPCVVRPEMTEGPYFVDGALERSDIRRDPADGSVRPGLPLALAFRVMRLDGDGCRPLAGAQVDVWHCDARGVYSGVRDPYFGGSRDSAFLRGWQRTDAQGRAQFATIFPGWYPGRTTHIHFKIRAADGGRHAEFTSQLYFDDALSEQVQARAPYADRNGHGRIGNGADFIYRRGGERLRLAPAVRDEVLAAEFDIALAME